MKRIDTIDILKGYSIFTIVLYHYLQVLNLPSPLNKAISFGGTGVHLFVVLSGLGLSYSQAQKKLTYQLFLAKRLAKIYLPYLFIVILSAGIALLIPIYKYSLYALGGHVFLYKMFDESIIGSYGYPLWFMSMIIQFYLVFHGMFWLKKRLTTIWFLVLGVAISLAWSTLVWLIDKENERVWSGFFLQYYWEFALGMVVGGRLVGREKLPGEAINGWICLSTALGSYLIGFFLYAEGGAVGKLVNDMFVLLGYALLALWLVGLNIQFINRFFLYIGTISLPVYLLHTLLQLTISSLLPITTIYPIGLAMILLLPLSALFQRGIDAFFKPLHASKDKQQKPITVFPAK